MVSSLLKMAVFVGLSAICGLTQATQVFKLPLIPDKQQVLQLESAAKGLRESAGMTAEALREHAAAGQLVIDARLSEQYAEEHLDAVLIVNLHPARFQEQLDQVMPYVGQPVAVYCNTNSCTLAEELAVLLKPMGFAEIRIYFDGWDGIKAAGLPTIRGTGVGQ